MTTKKTIKAKVSKETKRPAGQIGFYFDQTRCDGCYACIIACKDWHDVPAGPASWMRVSTIEKGKYPNPFLAFNASPCYHCGDASCVSACPVEAITKREADGIVTVDRDKCLGFDQCGFPCTLECPAGNDVQGFISLIREGKPAEAWRLLVENNPFPNVCGRVCAHPCETACNRGKVEEPIVIHALERFAGEYMPALSPFNIERNKKRIAIVGSGPSGLSCAYQLARRGYRPTVFEALPVAGGMLRVGIPEYRLPKAVFDQDIEFIKSVGVEIKTNMRVGQDLSLEELDKFDAVFLAVGTHKEKTLRIPGIDLKEIISGIGFLREVRLNGKAKVGKRVVVLGGGNVAFDCARTARRLGASEVHIVCPECYEDMLAEPAEREQAKEEGIAVHSSNLACKILGEGDNRAAGVECVSLRSMNFDENGKLHFDAIAGSESILPADTVIMAIGQDPDLSFLPAGIEVNRGMISIDEDGVTSRAKYFAGGDAATSQRKLAWAIGSGRRVALAIDRYLRQVPKEEPARKPTRESKFTNTDFMPKKERVAIPMLPVADRHWGFAEVELGVSNKQAKTEAERCLRCHGMCSIACPYDTPQFGAEDNPKMQKCNLCLEEWSQGSKPLCVRSCTMRALDADEIDVLRAKYGDVKKAEGFTYYKKNEPSITFKPKVKAAARSKQ